MTWICPIYVLECALKYVFMCPRIVLRHVLRNVLSKLIVFCMYSNTVRYLFTTIYLTSPFNLSPFNLSPFNSTSMPLSYITRINTQSFIYLADTMIQGPWTAWVSWDGHLPLTLTCIFVTTVCPANNLSFFYQITICLVWRWFSLDKIWTQTCAIDLFIRGYFKRYTHIFLIYRSLTNSRL